MADNMYEYKRKGCGGGCPWTSHGEVPIMAGTIKDGTCFSSKSSGRQSAGFCEQLTDFERRFLDNKGAERLNDRNIGPARRLCYCRALPNRQNT